MDLTEVSQRGLVLLGCGKMGTALLEGWLAAGLAPAAVSVLEPKPSARLEALTAEGLSLNGALPAAPAVVLLAVKPQMMGAALPALAALGNGDTLFVSIAAGTPIAALEAVLGAATPIVRAMPNTPAAIGRGISVLVASAHASPAAVDLADTLLQAVGTTERVADEALIDAVTGVSGSGPAYVFLMIEALAAAGAAQGLDPDLALRLARATVAGSGALAESSAKAPSELRADVTSPAGTTAAALEVLMRPDAGLPTLIEEAVAAAVARSRELGGR